MATRKVVKTKDGKPIVERPLRTYTLLLSKGGNHTNSWYEIGEGGINTNSVPFHPPFPMRLIGIQYSNVNALDASDFVFRFHEDGADAAGNIGTGDPVAVEISPDDLDIDFARTDKRAWSSADLFDRGIVLDPSQRYAGRIQRLAGTQSANDSVVILSFEEEES